MTDEEFWTELHRRFKEWRPTGLGEGMAQNVIDVDGEHNRWKHTYQIRCLKTVDYEQESATAEARALYHLWHGHDPHDAP